MGYRGEKTSFSHIRNCTGLPNTCNIADSMGQYRVVLEKSCTVLLTVNSAWYYYANPPCSCQQVEPLTSKVAANSYGGGLKKREFILCKNEKKNKLRISLVYIYCGSGLNITRWIDFLRFHVTPKKQSMKKMWVYRGEQNWGSTKILASHPHPPLTPLTSLSCCAAAHD